MARYRTEITTPADVATTFTHLADFSNAATWDPGVEDARRLDRGPIRVGSSFDVDVSFGPGSTTMRYEVVELVEDQKIVLESTTPMFTSVDTITVRPAGDGAVATYEAVLRLRGPLALFDPALGLAFDRIGDRAAEGLRTWLRALPAAEALR